MNRIKKIQVNKTYDQFKDIFVGKDDKYIFQMINFYQYCYCDDKCCGKKIVMLKKFERIVNIDPLTLNFDEIDKYYITTKFFKQINKTFGNREHKPNSLYELKKFYAGLLRNVFSEQDITDKKQVQLGKIRKIVCTFDMELVEQYTSQLINISLNDEHIQ